MEFYRIKAIFLRHCMLIPRDLHRHIDFLYWPLLDVILWGITASWLQSCNDQTNVALMVLTGLVLWHVVYRAHIEISYSLLDELWSQNMVNLFSSPITFGEWLIGLVLSSMVKVLLLLTYMIMLVYFLYGLNVISIGWPLIIFIVLLTVSGWTIGFFTTAFLSYFGQKIQTIAWVMGYFFAPFSAVYYPVASLPTWARFISYGLPMTYIFESMRELLSTGLLNQRYLAISMILNIVYFGLAILFFNWLFKQTKRYGLARLERFE